MGISDVKTKETSDPEVETNLTLEIGIKKQPGATVDHNKGENPGVSLRHCERQRHQAD